LQRTNTRLIQSNGNQLIQPTWPFANTVFRIEFNPAM